MALTRIAFYGMGIGIHAVRLASPSGQATMAMAFWPVLLALLVRRDRRGAGIAAGFTLGLLCSASRVATGAHTVSEAAVGAPAGAAVALAALHGLRSGRLPLPCGGVIATLPLGGLLLWAGGRPPLVPTERW